MAQKVPSSSAAMATRAPASATVSLRQEVIEALDQIVAAELEFKAIHGHFTNLLSRLAYALPPAVTESYSVRIQDASGSQLLVTAISEDRGKIRDVITMNHEFQLATNFPAPPPRPEYLKAQALRHLDAIREAGAIVPASRGLFKDYFEFAIARNESGTFAVASGIHAPVDGFVAQAALPQSAALTSMPDAGDMHDTQAAIRSANLLTEVIARFPKVRSPRTGERPGSNSGSKDLEIERIE